MPEFREVDPRLLRLPPSRSNGADPLKLHQQIGRYGDSLAGMPTIVTYRGKDGELMIFDGVTRATRVAKLRPGTTVRVEVLGDLLSNFGHLPTVGERLT